MINNIDWSKVLCDIAVAISDEIELNIAVEGFILKEIEDRINISLQHLDIKNPNVAKIAGIVMFWIRKLKPFNYAYEETAKGNKLHTLNELIAIHTGLNICSRYKDDYSLENFYLEDRLLIDWLHSLRYHSHSPYSSLFVFELLTSNNIEDNKLSGNNT